jgi:hypothetical protein
MVFTGWQMTLFHLQHHPIKVGSIATFASPFEISASVLLRKFGAGPFCPPPPRAGLESSRVHPCEFFPKIENISVKYFNEKWPPLKFEIFGSLALSHCELKSENFPKKLLKSSLKFDLTVKKIILFHSLKWC